MKEVLDNLIKKRCDAILSEKLYNEEIMQLLKEIKLILDVKKEID